MAKHRRGRPPRRDKDEHRVNRRIRISPIRVIGPDGDQLGVMNADEGRKVAKEHGLDLVEVAPNARPPVCRIMDYGKFRYEQAKKKQAARSQKVELKTIRLRPKTDDHDLNTKLRKATSFLQDGNPVRFVMRMRGRERAYPDRWKEVLSDSLDQLDEEFVFKSRPKTEGRTITATIEPTST